MINYEELKIAFQKVNLTIKKCNGPIFDAVYAIHIDMRLDECIEDIENIFQGSWDFKKCKENIPDYLISEKYNRTFIKIRKWTKLNPNLKNKKHNHYNENNEMNSDECLHWLMDAYEYEGPRRNFHNWLDSNGY